MTARIIGLGQRLGGDDAAGLQVIDRLRALGCLGGIEVLEAGDASGLIEALATSRRVIVVDAVLGEGEPGRVHLLSANELGRSGLAAVSTHGLDVAQAVGLARILHAGAVSPDIRLVGVEIARAERFREGLSPAVLAAVDGAARAVLDLARA